MLNENVICKLTDDIGILYSLSRFMKCTFIFLFLYIDMEKAMDRGKATLCIHLSG